MTGRSRPIDRPTPTGLMTGGSRPILDRLDEAPSGQLILPLVGHAVAQALGRQTGLATNRRRVACALPIGTTNRR